MVAAAIIIAIVRLVIILRVTGFSRRRPRKHVSEQWCRVYSRPLHLLTQQRYSIR